MLEMRTRDLVGGGVFHWLQLNEEKMFTKAFDQPSFALYSVVSLSDGPVVPLFIWSPSYFFVVSGIGFIVEPLMVSADNLVPPNIC